MLVIPVDRIQSSSGYIEFKTTNGNWSRIRNLNGSEPNRIIPSGRTIIMPNWGSLMGRHIHGGGHSAIELFYVDYNWNNILKPGDIIFGTRITNTNQILFGNGQILTPEMGIRNTAPTWYSFPFNINLPRNGTAQWERTQPIT